jgi:protein-S-isoprenylcysteine O-methyltransferase Ste14
MKSLLQYRPPRIAFLLISATTAVWKLSPSGTLLYLPYAAIGGTSLLGGFTLMMWAWFQFRKAKTAICPTDETTAMITRGAYGISRNPMYLGMVFMLVGAAFLMGAMTAVFAPVAFFLIIDKVFIPYEEEKLMETFGTGYSCYQQRTRRWI